MKMILDKKICEYQQNREPYLMIDYDQQYWKSAKGYKDFGSDEWFLKSENDPNVPGMLQTGP